MPHNSKNILISPAFLPADIFLLLPDMSTSAKTVLLKYDTLQALQPGEFF